MGTYIAMTAPAGLHTVDTYREPYTTNTRTILSRPVVAVYVPKSPTDSDAVHYVLGNGEIVRADNVIVKFDSEEIVDELRNLG